MLSANPNSSIDMYIHKSSSKHGVDYALIKGIIKQESSFNVNAQRYEKHLNDSSWGLMQVLLKTAKGITGNQALTATELIKPEVNIDIGTRYIAKQLKRYNGNIKDAISAYNAGTANKLPGGRYANQHYVDKVYGNYLSYGGRLPLLKRTYLHTNKLLYTLPLLVMGGVGIVLMRRI